MARKRKREGSTRRSGKSKRQKKSQVKPIEEQIMEDMSGLGVEEEWLERGTDLYEDESLPSIITVGDVRELIEAERYDLINPYEEVGECVLCGRPVRYIDIARSEYPDDIPIDEAVEVLCRICRGEVSSWDEYFEEGY